MYNFNEKTPESINERLKNCFVGGENKAVNLNHVVNNNSSILSNHLKISLTFFSKFSVSRFIVQNGGFKES